MRSCVRRPGESPMNAPDSESRASPHAESRAAHVFRLSSHVSRVAALSLEPRGALGRVDEAGRLVLHASNQSPHILKSALANLLKVPADQVRVVAKDVGGSFGMKSGAYPEDVLVLYAARKLGRPVRWISERRESFLADDHGRDISFDAELGLDRDGRFRALKVDFTVNVGCYLSRRSLFLLNNIGGIAGVYQIPHIEAGITGVFTNTMTNAPYRGAGRPEATYVIERLIDIAARDLGLDPFELRLRNLVPPSAMPYDTGFLFKYDCGEFEGNMMGVAELADRAGFVARKEESARRGMLRGLGMANPIEVAAGPFTKPRKDFTKLKVHADGTVTLYAGSMSTGQGIETTLTGLVASELGLSRDAIRYEAGDTDDLPDGRGNGGSPCGRRTATKLAARRLRPAALAEILEAKPDDIGFADAAMLSRDQPFTRAGRCGAPCGGKDPVARRDRRVHAAAVTFEWLHMVQVRDRPETGVVKCAIRSSRHRQRSIQRWPMARSRVASPWALGRRWARSSPTTRSLASSSAARSWTTRCPAPTTFRWCTSRRVLCRRLSILWASRVSARRVPLARWSPPSTPSAMRLHLWASGISRCRRRPRASGLRSRKPSARIRLHLPNRYAILKPPTVRMHQHDATARDLRARSVHPQRRGRRVRRRGDPADLEVRGRADSWSSAGRAASSIGCTTIS